MAASFIGHQDHILKLGTSAMVVKTDCRTAHQSLCSPEALSTIFVFNVGLLWAYLLAITTAKRQYNVIVSFDPKGIGLY